MKRLLVAAAGLFLAATTWGAVAKIGDTEYNTFAAAIGAVQDGETITMLADTSENWPVCDKACTIDLGGFKIKGFFGRYNRLGGVCTVRNGSMEGFDGAGGFDDKYPYGKMVFENITMTGDLWSDSHPITIRNCTLACIQGGDKPIVIESGNIKKLNVDSHTTKGNIIFKGGRFGGDFRSESNYGVLGIGCRWVETGDKDYPWEVKNDVAVGRLLHRWSFNGSLADSVGGLTAGFEGATWDNNSNPKNIRLSGAAKGGSYVNIPVKALPKDRAFTIEIFATQREIRSWGRIFSFGVGGAISEPLQNFFMGWTQGTDANKDQIRLRYNGATNVTVDNSLASYTLGVEWHIAFVYEPTSDGKGRFYWCKEDLGGRQRREYGVTTEFNIDFEAWGINNFWLGRSFWSGDSSACADYDELRIWGVALTPEQLSENAKLGPDALPSGATAVGESRAIWTGAAGGDMGDAANWSCVDNLGAAQSGAVPTVKDYTLCLQGEMAFNCPAGTTPRWGNVVFSPLAGAPKAKFANFRRPTGGTKSWQGGYWKDLGMYDTEFVHFPQGYLDYKGDITVPPVGASDQEKWGQTYLGLSTIRIDGWVFVPAEQAGNWEATVSADDYFGFAVDGRWLAITKTYTAGATGSAYVGPGWHRFAMVFGDTYGGYSAQPVSIKVNGANAVAFSSTNFTLGSADNTVKLTADCDWSGLGTLDLPAGLTIDLNGKNLTIAGAKGTFKGGVTIAGTGTLTVNGGTFDNNGITVANATVVYTNCVVAKAVWTGAGDRTNVNDPANWECKDADGHTITGGIPGANTVVELGAGTTFQISEGQTLTAALIQPTADTITLDADADWRGAFTASAVLPSDYARILYLDAPKGSYINTGIGSHGDLRIVMDATVQGPAEYWFGAWDTSNYKDWNVAFANDNSELFLAYGNQNYGIGSVVGNGRHTIELDRNYCLLDGALKVDRLHNAISYTDAIYLFAVNKESKGIGYRDEQVLPIRFYGCKIYSCGQLKRDFVPVQKTDGTVGAYDLVNKVFYGNSGSPAFVAGPKGYMKSVTSFVPQGPVDLKGHALTLAPTADMTAATVTDSSTGDKGTLNLKVTQTVNFAETYFTLSGNMKVVVDAGGAELTMGTKLVQLASIPPDSVTFELDAETAKRGIALVVSSSGGVFYGADPASTEAVTATWTGAAGDGDPTNAENWDATNLAGNEITGSGAGTVVLNAETVVTFNEDATVKVTENGFSWKQLTLGDGVILTLDATDWTGEAGDAIITTALGITPADDIARRIRVGGTTRYDVVLSADGNNLVTVKKSTLAWRNKNYGNLRDGLNDYSFLNMPLSDYATFVGPTNVFSCLVVGSETAWQNTWLKWSQNRFDGWFNVTAEQAGTWSVYQKFDDYEALAIDGDWKVLNNTFAHSTNVTFDVTAGWHHFTVIAGDTYGGYGRYTDAGKTSTTEPSIKVTLPGAENAVSFDESNFTVEDPTAFTAGDFAVAAVGETPCVTLDVAAGCRLVLDPAETQLKLMRAPTFAKGAKIALAAKYAEATSGSFTLMTWDAGEIYTYGVALTDLFDATSASGAGPMVKVLANEDGSGALVLSLNGANDIVTAHWTGAVDGDPAKAGNWVCSNALDQAVTAVPGLGTAVFVGGACNLSVPAGTTLPCATFKFSADVTFGADTDWRGLDFAKVDMAGHKVDVSGNKFYVASLVDIVSGEITSGAAGGEFHLDVPADTTVANTGLRMTGKLKLVKEGAGTYIAQCRDQSYEGGNDIVGGIATSPLSPGGDITYWSPWGSLIYGAREKTFTVMPGAMLDMNGNYDYRGFGIVLAGGTLRASGRDMAEVNFGCAGGITLTADSTYLIDATIVHNAYNANVKYDLNGHTLTVRLADGKYWKPKASDFSNNGGKIVITGDDGRFWNYGVIAASTVDWDFSCELEVKNNMTAHDFTCRSEGIWGWSTLGAKVSVYGTFNPVSDYFCNVEMQNGSTIDLSSKEGAWSTTSLDKVNDSKSADYNKHYSTTFAANATVTLDLGKRKFATGDKVIAWSAKPADTVKFSLKGGDKFVKLVAGDDGLYYRKAGMMILVQ